MSVSEFARHRGTTDRAVSAALAARRIKREPDGTINSEKADLDWDRNSREPRRDRSVDFKAGLKRQETWKKKNAARAAAVAAAQPQPVAPPAPEPDGTHEDVRHVEREFERAVEYGNLETNSLSYSDARALKENLDAKLKQIELEQRQGSVLPRAVVVAALETLFRVHRDAVLNVPNRIAGLVFEQTSVADVHAVLDDELRKSLDELADGLEKLAEREVRAA